VQITPQVAQVGVPTITKKQKTHGFLPLFLSQFLLLLATVGVGAALFVLPESKWKEAQEVILTFLQSSFVDVVHTFISIAYLTGILKPYCLLLSILILFFAGGLVGL
jgi:hypothetical protein